MRSMSQQYYAVAAVSQDISLEGQRAGARADGRAPEHRRRTAQAARDVVGHRWDTACGDLRRFLARNQISFSWVTPDAPELSTIWPGPRPADGELPVLRLADGADDRSARGARSGESPRPPDQRPRRRIRRRDHRRGAGRPCGRGLWRVRGTAHDRRRARGARRTGRDVVADRELSRISQRGLGRRAGQPCTPAGEAARRGDPGHALRRAHRSDDARSVSRRRRCRPRTNSDSRHRRHVASARHRRLRSAHRQGCLLWGRAQRSERHAWARHPPRRRRQLGRSGGAATSPTMRAR